MSCRNGGVVSVIGVYGGFVDKFPAGAWMNRGLTLRTGQCHVQRYMKPLLDHIENGQLDPTRVITPHDAAHQAPRGYDLFKHKKDNCEKVVLKPDGAALARESHRPRARDATSHGPAAPSAGPGVPVGGSLMGRPTFAGRGRGAPAPRT